MVISVAGRFDPESILATLNDLYTGAPTGGKNDQVHIHPSGPKTVHRSIVRRDTEQMRVTIGGYAPAVRSEGRYAAAVLALLFGGSMSSRLFLRVREEMGACYDIAAYNDLQAHTGFHCISAGIPPARVEEVTAAIADECKAVRDEPISDNELKRAKDQLLGRLAVAQESVGQRAIRQAVSYVQSGVCESDDVFVREVQAVTADDVQRVVRSIYKPENMAICYIGNNEVPSSCSDTFFTKIT